MNHTSFILILFSLLTFICEAQPIRNNSFQLEISNEQNQQLVDLFYQVLARDAKIFNRSLDYIQQNWHPSYAAPLIDMLVVTDQPRVKKRITNILKEKTGEDLGRHLYDWLAWLWDQPPTYDPFFADLKGKMYGNIDPKFTTYFTNRDSTAKIRIDEILWGGVMQDGIPPLRDPEMIAAQDAGYLYKEDIIFGIVVDGNPRAYPKRILGWHEMVVENIGDKKIAGVYCTLCGTMIAYNTEYQGIKHDLGTSGFLYRSNKLMYDQATQSLWNTIEGKPVLGPLVNRNIELETLPVMTTTWAEWRKLHPDTRVLSLKTGYRRNYLPGVAYRSYYATDDLMFPVPLEDKTLNNKESVFVIRSKGYQKDPIAITSSFLKNVPVYNDQIGGKAFVVITDKKGGSRAYEGGSFRFNISSSGILQDDTGGLWDVDDDAIHNQKGYHLARLPAHNIFWFAWYNTFPGTRLIK